MPRRSSILDHPARPKADQLLRAGDRSVASIARQLGMPPDSLKRYARRLRAGEPMPEAAPAALGPVETFEHAFGFVAMPHQVEVLEEIRPTLVVKGRQIGMTATAAALAVHTARSKAGSTTVIISPSLRQSTEVTARARLALWEWGEQLRQDSTSLLRTAAGSRIVSLPGSARGIRGYACDLVIIDEAAFVTDEAWAAARPLVSATGGRLVCQSTPGMPVGWFWELARAVPPGWAYLKVPSAEAHTIAPEFLERERREMAPELYAQEYEAEFTGGTGGGALFHHEQLAGLILPPGAAA